MERTNDMASYLFHQGTNYFSYEYMGAHKIENGYVFRVWAPNADSIFLTGDFNGWSEDTPMVEVDPAGLWEGFVPCENVCEGSLYKYKFIKTFVQFIYRAPIKDYSRVEIHPMRFGGIQGGVG